MNKSQTASHNLEEGLYGKHSCDKNCWQKQVAKCLVELLVETLASKFCSSIVIHQTHKKVIKLIEPAESSDKCHEN